MTQPRENEGNSAIRVGENSLAEPDPTRREAKFGTNS